MKMLSRFAALSFAVLLPFALLAGCGQKENSSGNAGDLTDGESDSRFMDGSEFFPDGLAEKDVTILNFWGTFCSPCKEEMPDLAEYAKALPENIQLVTVCTDYDGNEEQAKTIMESAGFEGITLYGGDGDFKALCDTVQYLPTTVFLDSEGNVVGETIIGSPVVIGLAETYTKELNNVLKAMDKEEISFDE